MQHPHQHKTIPPYPMWGIKSDKTNLLLTANRVCYACGLKRSQNPIYLLTHLFLKWSVAVSLSFKTKPRLVILGTTLTTSDSISSVRGGISTLQRLIPITWLLSLIIINAPWYHTQVSDFLRVDFHRTNYGIHEPLNGAVRSFNEFAGLFDLHLSRDQFFYRLRSVL
jgi:hypothetical protein